MAVDDDDEDAAVLTNDAAVESDDASGSGFFWEFRGHSCYAEIDQPSKARNSSSNKPTVVLIHGFACSTVYWRETRAFLREAGYTVHAVDLLGQGRSAKPGRSDGVEYSIDLWAKMVDEYASQYIAFDDETGDKDGTDGGVVLVGNSLGSLVALSVATGDCYNEENTASQIPFLRSRVKGLCYYNCAVGLNIRNAIKSVPQQWLKVVLMVVFDVLDRLVFDNKALLTYVIDNKVSKDLIRTALTGLYAYAEDPETKVDDELVDSFINPVLNDSTEAVVEVLSQIYTNDAGRTPMELQSKYLSTTGDETGRSKIPIHLIWGDQDTVAPVNGDVGTYYSKLAAASGSNVSMEVINNAGHVLFDERPECNAGLIEWLEEKIIA